MVVARSNDAVADMLQEFADVLAISGGDSFKVRGLRTILWARWLPTFRDVVELLLVQPGDLLVVAGHRPGGLLGRSCAAGWAVASASTWP